MRVWRLLNSNPLPGSLNMGIDQALLQLYAKGASPPTLRLYQWSPPAVSLGYFQHSSRLDKAVCQRLGIDVVRRPTGGKAVLHQGDLTYALVAGADDGLPASVEATYKKICEGLIAGLRLLGIEAAVGRQRIKSPQPEVCFLRSVVGDIVHDGRKFVGSAQTWYGASVLQHGSIMLEPQVETLTRIFGTGEGNQIEFRRVLRARLTSMREIMGRGVGLDEVSRAVIGGIKEEFGVVFEQGEMSPVEWNLAQELARGESRKLAPGSEQLFGHRRRPRIYSSLEKKEGV